MLTRWDPFAEISRLQNSLFSRPWLEPQEFRPAVDIYEDEKAIKVKAELPGVKPEEVKIEVEHGVLTLSGERKLEHEEKKEGYHRVERSYGAFSRSFVLPEGVETEKIEANYKEGVLTLTLPKGAETQRKEIKITTH